MNLEELRAKLIEWLSEYKTWTKSSQQHWDDYIWDNEDPKWKKYKNPHEEDDKSMGDSNQPPTHLHILLFTKDYVYQIAAHPPRPDKGSYLGCIATSRVWRVGENWHRGSDLPDGEFSKDMFDKIMKAILGYELLAKSKE